MMDKHSILNELEANMYTLIREILPCEHRVEADIHYALLGCHGIRMRDDEFPSRSDHMIFQCVVQRRISDLIKPTVKSIDLFYSKIRTQILRKTKEKRAPAKGHTVLTSDGSNKTSGMSAGQTLCPLEQSDSPSKHSPLHGEKTLEHSFVSCFQELEIASENIPKVDHSVELKQEHGDNKHSLTSESFAYHGLDDRSLIERLENAKELALTQTSLLVEIQSTEFQGEYYNSIASNDSELSEKERRLWYCSNCSINIKSIHYYKILEERRHRLLLMALRYLNDIVSTHVDLVKKLTSYYLLTNEIIYALS